jgi:cytochrome c
MYAYGHHIRVKNVETNLVTMDSRVASTFTTMCKSSGQDSSPIKAYLEYVGWVEEILELDYGTTCVIVLFCN